MSIEKKLSKPNYPANKTLKKKITKQSKHKMEKQGVSIITATNNESFIVNIFDNFDRQTYKNKELIIIVNKNGLNIDKYESKAKAYDNVSVYRIDESISLGHCLNYAVSISKYPIIAKFDDDDYYGPKYLSHSVKAFKHTEASVVGKCSHLVYFQQLGLLAIRNPKNENKYVKFVNGSTLLFKKSIFDKVQFPDISIGEDTRFCGRCIKNGIKIYSTDRYDHVYIRQKSKATHTWKITDKVLLGNFCKPIMHTKDYKSYADKIKNRADLSQI